MSDSNTNIKKLVVEKCDTLKAKKDISNKYKKIQELISNTYHETISYNILLESKDLDNDQKNKIENDLTSNKTKIEKFIREKEVLKKDITILQYRIKYLENEIKKSKPFWQRLINFS